MFLSWVVYALGVISFLLGVVEFKPVFIVVGVGFLIIAELFFQSAEEEKEDKPPHPARDR